MKKLLRKEVRMKGDRGFFMNECFFLNASDGKSIRGAAASTVNALCKACCRH